MTRSALAVVAVALGVFLAMLTFLAVRVRTGHDPALGAAVAPAPAPAPRRVLVRRLVERRVLITVKRPSEEASGTAAQVQSASAAPASPAPASTSARPPAPAPVATRSS
jgi:hypothetical protein